MPGNNEIIGLSAGLTVEDALKELRRIGVGGEKEAKAIAAAMDRAAKATQAAAKRAADDMKKSGAAGETAYAKAAKALGPLGGVLSRISPEAGAAASSIAGLTGAAEGFAGARLGVSVAGATAALAALAAVVGTGYLAWRAYNEEGDRAVEVANAVSAAEDRLAPLLDATRRAQLDAAVATGEMTAAAAKLERDGGASMRAFGAATAETTARIRELHDGEGSLSRHLGDFAESLSTDPLYAYSPAILAVGWALGGVTTSSSEAQVEIDALSGVVEHAAEITKEGAEATRDLDAATTRKAAADKAASAAARNHAEAVATLTRQIEAQHQAAQDAANAAQDAAAIIAKSGEFRLSAVERLSAAQDEALYQYRTATWDTTRSVEEIAAGEATLRANQQEELTLKVREEAGKRAAAEEAALARVADAQREQTAATLSAINQVSSYISQAVGMATAALDASYASSADNAQRLTEQLMAGESYYTDAQKAELEERVEANKDAARRAFYASKAAKIGEAVASTALAVINAIAEVPWPLNIAAGAAAGAAGALAVGTIAGTEPAFHQGLAPDERRARVMKQETILSPTGSNMLPPGAARDMNAGVSPGRGYGGPAPIVVGHRVFDDLIKRELRTAGALTVALTGGSSLGHRTNRRGTTG